MAPDNLTVSKRRETVQDVIDRILYVPGYKEALTELNQRFKINAKIESNGTRRLGNVQAVK